MKLQQNAGSFASDRYHLYSWYYDEFFLSHWRQENAGLRLILKLTS